MRATGRLLVAGPQWGRLCCVRGQPSSLRLSCLGHQCPPPRHWVKAKLDPHRGWRPRRTPVSFGNSPKGSERLKGSLNCDGKVASRGINWRGCSRYRGGPCTSGPVVNLCLLSTKSNSIGLPPASVRLTVAQERKRVQPYSGLVPTAEFHLISLWMDGTTRHLLS